MGSPKRTQFGNIIAALGALAIFGLEDLVINNSNGKFWLAFVPSLILGIGSLLAWIDFTFKAFPPRKQT